MSMIRVDALTSAAAQAVGPVESGSAIGSIGSIGSIEQGGPVGPSGPAQGAEPVSFEKIFGKVIDQANVEDRNAAAKTEALASGLSDDIHGTMITVKEAEITVKLVNSIRNKLLDAYNQIWRISV